MQEQPTAVVLGGGIACGKTTLAQHFSAGHIKYIDIDYLSPVRETGYELAIKQIVDCIQDRKNFVLASPIGPEIPRLLADIGYAVHVMYCDVPEALAYARASRRARQEQLDIIHATHVLAVRSFMAIRECPNLKSVMLFKTILGVWTIYDRDKEPAVRRMSYWRAYLKKAEQPIDPASPVLQWERKGTEDFKLALSRVECLKEY